jgi:hypothetical protein
MRMGHVSHGPNKILGNNILDSPNALIKRLGELFRA